ncbi:MAG: isoaspartyl peptidase/L-asparaginase family protein [Candidatus Binataceae bacterium]
MEPRSKPALVIHGGAGARGPAAERPRRRRGMLRAANAGAEILRAGGSALDSVLAAVTALEDDPWFNAGYGSVLNIDGRVEMDAALMVARREKKRRLRIGEYTSGNAARTAPALTAGAVAAVSRVRNPILLARAVMERTPHVLMSGPGAERLAHGAGLKMCRPDDLITPRARIRLRAMLQMRLDGRAECAGADLGAHGTVGAVAIDVRGEIAAATSTGGITGKLAGRIGDSAIIGAGVFATRLGGASATGQGEAIIRLALCRDAVLALRRLPAEQAAHRAIAELGAATGAEAGIIVIDSHGRVGYSHNAGAMEVATFDAPRGICHCWAERAGEPARK